jgi:hypothetical protein
MTKLIFASALTIFATAAQAGDLSLGYKGANGQPDTALISVRVEGAKTRIRVVGSIAQAGCTRWRKDLCGKEGKIQLVEATVPSAKCTIQTPLVNCFAGDIRRESTAVVTFTDGTQLNLEQFEVSLLLGEERLLTYDDTGTKIVEKTAQTIDMQVWGQRADGLDPLITTPSRGFLSHQDYDIVSTSLFD